MKIIFFGDITAKPGREAIKKILPELKAQYKPDLTVANIENLAHGKGITISTVEEMLEAGIEFFTSGNHIYRKPAYMEVFEKYGDKVIRPANISSENELAGDGYKTVDVAGTKVLVVNLMGQVFMETQFDEGKIENPFFEINKILELNKGVKIVLVDFHAEATSEKRGMGFWTDGRVSLVLGTHTHVPTADAQILPEGTGYVTDAGMTGAANSILGVDKESAMKRFLATDPDVKPPRLEIAEADKYEVSYVVAEIDDQTGKCQNIKTELKRI